MASAPIVELSGVWKSYRVAGVDVPILQDIDLTVDEGEFVTVLGVSGSGKTTLLNLIGGVDKLTEGQLSVCGAYLQQLSSRKLTAFRRDRVGFIFQFYNLIPTLTAEENVMIGLEAKGIPTAESREIADNYLRAVRLGDKMKKFPEQLSGGEQQRVAIARALAKQPPLVLADEPTGNLDQETGHLIIELLRKHEGTTYIVVTHNPELTRFSDRTVLLRDGRLHEKRAGG